MSNYIRPSIEREGASANFLLKKKNSLRTISQWNRNELRSSSCWVNYPLVYPTPCYFCSLKKERKKGGGKNHHKLLLIDPMLPVDLQPAIVLLGQIACPKEIESNSISSWTFSCWLNRTGVDS